MSFSETIFKSIERWISLVIVANFNAWFGSLVTQEIELYHESLKSIARFQKIYFSFLARDFNIEWFDSWSIGENRIGLDQRVFKYLKLL